MAIDTSYKPFPILFQSKGIVARPALDRAPMGTYLNLANAEERIEESLSSRYGSQIVNRDPNGTPGGVNYFLPFKTTLLARLKALTGQVYRYANSGGLLYRRAGDSQGPYSLIAGGFSGNPFSSLVVSSFQSALPYIFLYDSTTELKDTGIGTPTRIGIFGPPYPVTAAGNAPAIAATGALIESFQASSGFTTSGFTISGLSAVGTVNGVTASPILNFLRYACVDKSVKLTQSGMVGKNGSGNLQLIFNIQQDTSLFDIANINGPSVTPTDAFAFTSVIGSIGASATGTIGKTVTQNFSAYDDDDLFVLAFQVSGPAAVQEVRLQFDVNGSGYSSSYYYKSLVPASYQSSVSLPGVTDATQAVALAVFARAAGITNLNQINSSAQNLLPPDDPTISQLQPTNMTTGAGSWSVVYLRKGEFLAVGNAGKPGLDWSNITGWQVKVITNSQGSTNVAFNALYIQSGGGPSSYGGVGYDYRYTFYNALTGTESNPSGIQSFAKTPTNPTGSSTLVVLRQQIDIFGYFSLDPQVTHVRIYRRGGNLSDNWRLIDQFPNVLSASVTVSATITAINIVTFGGVHYVTLTFSGLNPFPLGSFVLLNGLTLQAPWLNGQVVQTISPTIPHPGPNQIVFTVPSIPSGGSGGETGTAVGGFWAYFDVIPDSQIVQADLLKLDNDVPVTSTLQTPIVTTLSAPIAPSIVLQQPVQPVTVTVADATAVFVPNQIVDVGTEADLEQVVVVTGGTGTFTACFQLAHPTGEPVFVFSLPGVNCNLAAQAYNLNWLAGDPHNPNALYYNNAGYPESFSPANHIPVGSPGDPIMALVNFRGTLFVATLTTWYQIFAGSPPYAQSTGSKHGLAASFGWALTETAILYQAIDGIREFRGADGAYLTLQIEWLFQNVNQSQTLISELDLTQISSVQLAYWNNILFISYLGQDGVRHRLMFHYLYKRFRNDDVPATALLTEEDTNTLLYAKHMDAAPVSLAFTITSTGVFTEGPDAFAKIFVTPTPSPDLSGLTILLSGITVNTFLNGATGPVLGVGSFGPNSIVFHIPSHSSVPDTPDTGTALVTPSSSSSYAIVQDRIGDYDDAGWVSGALTQSPIPFIIQTPYLDMGAPNNQKQFNVFDLDVFPNGQTLTLTLLWDDGGTITPIVLGTLTGTTRQKFQFILNGGDGQQAYRVSIKITGSVLAAPTIYQASFHAAVLPEQIKSFDTYWIKFGTDESKLVKQGYVDYTATSPISVQLFADGSTTPYYTFTLAANPTRSKVPVRVRYPAAKIRLWRYIAVSEGPFQFWSAPQVDHKPVCQGKGYQRGELIVP